MAFESVTADGFGGAGRAAVTDQGRQRVSGIFEPGNSNVVHTEKPIGTTSEELVVANPLRMGIQIQNRGSVVIHIRFGDEDATTDDYAVNAGETYMFPPGSASPDAIQAIAVGSSSSSVAVLEFNRSECAW